MSDPNCNQSEKAGFAVARGWAAFEPRKSWVLVSPGNKIIHLADNRRVLKLLMRKGDRIERAQISPLGVAARKPPTSVPDAAVREAVGERTHRTERPNTVLSKPGAMESKNDQTTQ